MSESSHVQPELPFDEDAPLKDAKGTYQDIPGEDDRADAPQVEEAEEDQ